MRGARRLAALILTGLFACAQEGAQQTLPLEDPTRAPAGLVVVSVTGLGPERYREVGMGAPDMPTLAAMAEAGVRAEAVRPVAPASRYPAHATLLSGRRPAQHGIVADRRLGERGVRNARYTHASLLRAPVLWQVASDAGLRVAALGWPSTVGASIALNLPDLEPTRRDESWPGVLEGAASPELLVLVRELGGEAPAAQGPGAARDAVLAGVACRLLAAAQPPQLLLLQLDQTGSLLAAHGTQAPETRAAFAAVDADIARLLDCVDEAGRLDRTAFAVMGDHGALPVHSVVAPNVALADAGLLTARRKGDGLLSWSAIARSNGGSAFVYAKGDEDAMLARRALGSAAERTHAFRVVPAEEMLRLGADPDAWFGIEAEPGYLLSDLPRGPLVRAAGVRAGWGYLPYRREMDAGFVAWGAGWARGVRVPEMWQTDIGPTLARLLGLSLESPEGRVLVGVLRTPRVSVAPAAQTDAR
jgi:hypothetical protein